MSHAENPDRWTTIATYSWVPEAQMLRTRLESEGLEVLVPEENTASVSPIYTGMQVRVQVRARDVAQAKEILASSAPTEEESASIDALALSTENPHEEGRRRAKSSNWFRALIGLLFFIPMRRK